MICVYLEIHKANILLLADNVKIFRAIKSVEATNYQELREHARVWMYVCMDVCIRIANTNEILFTP